MNKNLWLAVIASANILLPTAGFSHSRLSIITATGTLPRLVPRNSSDANKGTDADAPCGAGSTARGTNPVVLVVGETVTVPYEETIDHMGQFLLNFSQAGQVNFTPLAAAQTDGTGTLTKGQFQFTVPNTPCTDCTIQFVQTMGATTNYRSCVDVIITPANAPAPAAPAGFAITK